MFLCYYVEIVFNLEYSKYYCFVKLVFLLWLNCMFFGMNWRVDMVVEMLFIFILGLCLELVGLICILLFLGLVVVDIGFFVLIGGVLFWLCCCWDFEEIGVRFGFLLLLLLVFLLLFFLFLLSSSDCCLLILYCVILKKKFFGYMCLVMRCICFFCGVI